MVEVEVGVGPSLEVSVSGAVGVVVPLTDIVDVVVVVAQGGRVKEAVPVGYGVSVALGV